MARRNRLLVPEAREAVDQLKANIANVANHEDAKFEIAKETGIPLQKGYNGTLTAKEAGKIGGSLGGNMVKEMIRIAQEKLQNKDKG
ncbi:alpha/beta-type small acid-soluble spore protein [Metabacillus fastidiosus]|uniref:Alpha/beta-type small acid-soluble spore protein n=1 Tax=Metabacillus fastidiosus TaxID=1458 RepID=A0ABU6P4Q2_9BACI|nr:alpha/beta-type small acid-soluble spore protein [Metabacillus fastidiosus]MED4452428.1 alpha/beta-type small acid-soluble spore protein [Metabacillus fastidiosus]